MGKKSEFIQHTKQQQITKFSESTAQQLLFVIFAYSKKNPSEKISNANFTRIISQNSFTNSFSQAGNCLSINTILEQRITQVKLFTGKSRLDNK